MFNFKNLAAGMLLVVFALIVSACGPAAAPAQPTAASQPTMAPAEATTAPAEPTAAPAGATEAPAAGLAGQIAVDGSSTVFPITEAVAEEFGKAQPSVRVTVGVSGTGGGFQKFCSDIAADRTAVQNASRAISEEEMAQCAANGIEYTEFLVGLDGLTVVVNPANEFASCLTTAELKTIWDTGSTVNNWNQVRADFPDQALTLYGPGTDSGTFDFFTEEINGEAGQSRADFTASEDDNTLVQGVSGDANALGYFGLAYYLENMDSLKAVEVDGGEGCIAPSAEAVANGTYTPLSRPLYIYVSNAELGRPEVFDFVAYYLSNAGTLVPEVGYVTVGDEAYAADLLTLAGLKK